MKLNSSSCLESSNQGTAMNKLNQKETFQIFWNYIRNEQQKGFLCCMSNNINKAKTTQIINKQQSRGFSKA
jgi:hypothetical protein